MDVSENRATQKWMVKIMENLIKMDALGVPLFKETPKCPPSFRESPAFPSLKGGDLQLTSADFFCRHHYISRRSLYNFKKKALLAESKKL